MRIKLDFRSPTPTHCKVAVFVNGAYTGTLVLRQDEIGSFHQVISNGLSLATDEFLSTGDPNFKRNDDEGDC
jgi:hypothetical protein